MPSPAWKIAGIVIVALGFILAALPRHNVVFSQRKDSAKKTEQISYAKHVAPIVAKYCTGCHGGKRPRAGLALNRFKNEVDALKKPNVWQKVVENLNAGIMPPAGRAKPTLTEMKRVVDWVENKVLRVDCTKEQNPGRVTIHRLNRAEYKNTIRDLAGIDFRPANDFPADDVGHGFDNISDVLTVSPLLTEKYLSAAEQVIAQAFKNPKIRARILFKNITEKNKYDVAAAVIERFAKRAYRRPVSCQEIMRLLRFIDLAEKNGDNAEKGIQLALQAVLVSPHFLFRVERTPLITGNQTHFHISEYELASRLSYFLWSSMPDEELFNLASKKLLRKGDTLEKQVQRMLKDPKAQALTKNFAGQWLQIRRLKTVKPDRKHFPRFNNKLRQAMMRETELFFGEIVRGNRSILDFLDGEFTFVNETLAKHYGLSGIKGEIFRKVSLKGSKRRGILTQASILTVTSNPTRTSPVNRGKWILDNILNTPPPPPPPDVPELAESGKEFKGTLRQQMVLHRTNPTCASCHKRMDPLGFGLENFDGIGGWRDKESGLPVDASGKLPNGETFNGPIQLVGIIKKRAAEFRRCLAEKMLTYAIGRGLERYDKCAVDDITKAVVRNQNRFSSLVLAVVRSDPFQKRKGQKK